MMLSLPDKCTTGVATDAKQRWLCICLQDLALWLRLLCRSDIDLWLSVICVYFARLRQYLFYMQWHPYDWQTRVYNNDNFYARTAQLTFIPLCTHIAVWRHTFWMHNVDLMSKRWFFVYLWMIYTCNGKCIPLCFIYMWRCVCMFMCMEGYNLHCIKFSVVSPQQTQCLLKCSTYTPTANINMCIHELEKIKRKLLIIIRMNKFHKM